jgi:hypothetical protein
MQPVGRRDNNKWKPSSFGIEPTAMQASRSIHGTLAGLIRLDP